MLVSDNFDYNETSHNPLGPYKPFRHVFW